MFVLVMAPEPQSAPSQLSEAWYHAVFDVHSVDMWVYVKNSLTWVFWKEGGTGREREGKSCK